MSFKQITSLYGLIGVRWLWPRRPQDLRRIIGCDRPPYSTVRAMPPLIWTEDPVEAIQGSDLIVLATPVAHH